MHTECVIPEPRCRRRSWARRPSTRFPRSLATACRHHVGTTCMHMHGVASRCSPCRREWRRPCPPCVPGLIVLYYETYELLALPALASTYLITITGIRLTPHSWAQVNDRGDYASAVRVFTKVAIVIVVFPRPPLPLPGHRCPAAPAAVRCAACSFATVSGRCPSGGAVPPGLCDSVLVRDRLLVGSIRSVRRNPPPGLLPRVYRTARMEPTEPLSWGNTQHIPAHPRDVFLPCATSMSAACETLPLKAVQRLAPGSLPHSVRAPTHSATGISPSELSTEAQCFSILRFFLRSSTSPPRTLDHVSAERWRCSEGTTTATTDRHQSVLSASLVVSL